MFKGTKKVIEGFEFRLNKIELSSFYYVLNDVISVFLVTLHTVHVMRNIILQIEKEQLFKRD